MRAFTPQAYRRMRLRTPGMEFASEMVVRAALNVPISPEGEVANPFRLTRAVPTIEYLQKKHARVVLIGEATHGTSEFYRMRDRITRELIVKRGFRFVAIEGDWPDAARIDHYVRHLEYPASEWTAFARFPTWMWRNGQVAEFLDRR